MKTVDVTAGKRASTEVESDSSVSKKPKIEGEDDTDMEEDSDSDSGRAWSVEAKEEEGEVKKPPNYLNMPMPEPEWDKDSYDDYECVFDPDGREGFPDDAAYEEFRQYKINAWKNRGFLEDPFRSVYAITDMEEPFRDKTTSQYLASIASLCVKKLNERNGSSVEVVSIVRANMKAGGGWKVYITFMAREYPNGPLVEYQAKAMDYAGARKPPFPILCRPASSIF